MEKIQEDIRKENIPDVDSIYVFLKDIDPSLTAMQYSGIEDLYDSVAHFLVDLRIQPKGFQVGAAMALYRSLTVKKTSTLHWERDKHKAALLTMPPASGKSYVIALLCAMVCEGMGVGVDNVVISFNHETLSEKDHELYESMNQMFVDLHPERGLPVNIHLVHTKEDLATYVTENTLVIHDDVDEWWIGKENIIEDAKWVVGVSSIPYSNAMNDVDSPFQTEAIYLDHLGIKVIDSNLRSPLSTHAYDTVSSIEEFFLNKGKLGGSGFLIYAPEEVVPTIFKCAYSCSIENIEVNCFDTTVHEELAGKILVVTPEHLELLTGFNYRSTTRLHLLLCASLPNERAFYHALGRVGRFNDSCSRSILTGVGHVDGCCQGLLNARLNKTVNSRRQVKKDSKETAKIDKYAGSKINKQENLVVEDGRLPCQLIEGKAKVDKLPT